MKLSLDLAIGDSSTIDSTDKGKLGELVGKVRDLNGRLGDIRREQVFQRVSPFGYVLYLRWKERHGSEKT